MIKKLKISLLVAVLYLSVVVGVNSASAAPLNYSSNTKVTLNGMSFTILSGSVADSVVVNANTLVVGVTSPGPFTLVSNDGYTLGPSAGSSTCTNNSTTTSYTISTSTTITFTPTTVRACGSNGSIGLTNGTTTTTTTTATTTGGGGGGGGSSSTPPVSLTVTTPASTDSGCSGGNKYNTSTGQLCVNNTGNENQISSVSAGVYDLGTATLKNGSKGDAVKELQKVLNKILNMNLKIDGKLGPKTIKVIKQWQKAHGLKADGLIGAKTKAAMKAEAEK